MFSFNRYFKEPVIAGGLQKIGGFFLLYKDFIACDMDSTVNRIWDFKAASWQYNKYSGNTC